MADLTSPSSSSSPPPCSLLEKPVAFSASSSSSAGDPDDAFEDGCSICLDPFTAQNPATVTSCRHEYHLQCILEWSQRSKECPICWQLFVLKDPASQELLTALESERNSRPRNMSPLLPPSYYMDPGVGEVSAPIDDSDFEDCIMRHLSDSAAASRARYFHRRERQRPFGFGPLDPSSPISPSANSRSSPAIVGDEPAKHRVLFSKQESDSSERSSPSEMFSFSESIKSKWCTASARYKESISKGTRGLKEKLLARNNSVRELSKGVQHEMTAGITGVARMIERLELASKGPGASTPVSSDARRTSNFLFKGKGVEENRFTVNLSKNSAVFESCQNSDAPVDASCPIQSPVEVPQTQEKFLM